jgi:hypothetical protein
MAVVFLMGAANFSSAENAMTESQVKALCVLNFAKYVTWPEETGVSDRSSSMRIGIVASSKLASDLKAVAKGKTISGKAVEIMEFSSAGDVGDCDVLFIGGSDKGIISEILNRVRTAPVLTVGEDERFAESGGIINFVVKENRVRFEVDLTAARMARVQISSKLLSLADKVRGKQ